MHKKDLIKAIAAKLGYTLKDTEDFVNAFLDSVKDILVTDEPLVLTGFGTFKVVHTKERIGRNPQNKKEMKIPASKKVKFTVGKDLKTAVIGENA